MANITFNSETYNAFLADKKCCIATQVSEYIDAMYSASSDADCLLDELRENVYYVKFLESGYIPVGDVLYPENNSCANYANGFDYSSIIIPGGKLTIHFTLSFYDLDGNLATKNFTFNPYANPGAAGSPTYIDNYLTAALESAGFNNVQITVDYSFPNFNIKISANNLIVFKLVDVDNSLTDYYTYSCDYVYASENTNCLTDDNAVKMSNLIHCDCCN